jgi:HAD superfamily hydrolase (TIGR01490 family)
MTDRCAFFDVDGTCISVKSMFSFQEYWYRTVSSADCRDARAFADEMAGLHKENASRETINRRYYAHFAGRRISDVQACAQAWFAEVARDRNLFHPAPLARLREHDVAGDVCAFVSGSFPAILCPIAEFLGVKHILATNLVVADGRYTGELNPPQMIGQGKADAITAFLSLRGWDASGCWAYGDDISDLPMLATVGHKVVVAGDAQLEAHARAAGWEILSPAPASYTAAAA